MDALKNSKKISLLAVAILFLFTFFNLILDAPRIVVISQHLDLTLLYADWTCCEINSLTHSHLVVLSLFL